MTVKNKMTKFNAKCLKHDIDKVLDKIALEDRTEFVRLDQNPSKVRGTYSEMIGFNQLEKAFEIDTLIIQQLEMHAQEVFERIEAALRSLDSYEEEGRPTKKAINDQVDILIDLVGKSDKRDTDTPFKRLDVLNRILGSGGCSGLAFIGVFNKFNSDRTEDINEEYERVNELYQRYGFCPYSATMEIG